MTEILGRQWTLAAFRPVEPIPPGGRLTSYSGGLHGSNQLQAYVAMIETGKLEFQ